MGAAPRVEWLQQRVHVTPLLDVARVALGDAGSSCLGSGMAAHKVLRGISYGSKRAEAGAVVNDIPASSVKWLTEQGIIEPTDAPKPSKQAKREPVSDDEGDE